MIDSLNVLGTRLVSCSEDPMTGFTRTGCCETGPEDRGRHVICSRVTAAFLEFSATRGNDLVSSRPGFPGLKPGDQWCLCAARWQEAYDAGVAPPVFLAATHASALEIISKDALFEHALDATVPN